MLVPFSPPDISEAEVKLVCEALTSGWITTGPKTKEFEKRISEYCGTKKTACLNSATACLETTLRVLGIGQGDEVITTAYTYTASASVIEHVGAKVVLVDTEDFFISPEKVKKAINKRTKAIIAVDIAGVPVDPLPLYKVIDEAKGLFCPASFIQIAMGRIALIADAAHSLGAKRGDRRTGTLCDFTCFSFHAVKNLTTAEGGAVTWKSIYGIDDEEIYKQYMLYSLHGQDKDALTKSKKGQWRYDILIPGYKCNMTDIMAAIGIAQLERYEEMLRKRRELTDNYDKAFKDFELIEPLSHVTKDYVSSCHLYILRVKGIDEIKRDEIIEKMAVMDISVNVHYAPLPMMTAYKNMGFDIKDFPVAYKMYENEITLPLFSAMTKQMQDYVIKSFIEVVTQVCS